VAARAKRRHARDVSEQARTRTRPSGYKRRSCSLCKEHVREVDYKDLALLRRYLSEKGKIRSRDRSGACRRHQHLIAVAIKRAREMALLAYVAPNDSHPERQRPRR
jgi:small subunit ribosomal protein S18